MFGKYCYTLQDIRNFWPAAVIVFQNKGTKKNKLKTSKLHKVKQWKKLNWASYTYLLTPWSRVLLEKLTGFQLVKKFLAFYGTRRFITTVISAHHLSLSWASSIQSIPPHPTSWRSSLILSSHLCWVSKVVSFPQVSPPKPCICLSSPPYVLHGPATPNRETIMKWILRKLQCKIM